MQDVCRNFIVCAALCLFIGCAGGGSQRVPPPLELRGVWLTDMTMLQNRETVAEAMDVLARNNFNAVFPVVWNGGTTLYPSKVMHQWFRTPEPSAEEVRRDPLAAFIEEAHKRDIAVFPVFGLGLSSTTQGGDMIATLRPQWRARSFDGSVAGKYGVEWLNPLHPEVQEFLISIVSEVVRTYNVDGIQGGDRLFAQPVEGGYDSVTTELYRETHAGNNPPQDVAETHWKYWRAVRINSVAQKLFWRVKAFKSDCVMMWAPLRYREALDGYLQDWRTWINESAYADNYADIITPQIHAGDLETYKRSLDTQHKDSLKIRHKMRYQFPGVVLREGTDLAREDDLIEAVRYNRLSGYNGEVFFSYEVLSKDNARLAAALKRTYYGTPARIPFPTAGKKSR